MTTWTNEDGLLIRFDVEQGAVALDGSTSAKEVTLEVAVADATTLTDADTAVEAGDRPFIPAGAVIKDAYFVVDTAFTSGGSAVLDLGLKEADGSTIDDDGLDAAIAVAALTVNSVTVGNGALVPSKTAVDSYPTITYDTAAFTAGAGKLVIKYAVH